MAIQILDIKKHPSKGERLSGALDSAMQFSQKISQQQQQQQQMQRENEAAKREGFNLEGFETPETRMQAMKYGFENNAKAQKFAQEMQQNKQIISKLEIDRGLPPGSLDAYISDPKMAEQASRPAKKTGEDPEKKEREFKAKKELLKESGRYKTEEELDESARNLDMNAVRDIWKESKKTPKKTKSEELIETDTAKGFLEARKEIPKLDAELANIETLRKMGKENLSGVGGYIKSAFGTGSAAEYNTLASSLLEPVIKIFNPVGAVPVTKLNWIKDTFRPSAGELQATQKAKLNTLQTLISQAKDRAQKKIKLFDDYRGNPPESEVFKFDTESSNLLNQWVDQQQIMQKYKDEVPEGKILMMDPQGNPLHVNPDQVEYFKGLKAVQV